MQLHAVIVQIAIFFCVILPVIVYDTLTFVFYFLWQRPWRSWPLFARPRSIREDDICPEDYDDDDDDHFVDEVDADDANDDAEDDRKENEKRAAFCDNRFRSTMVYRTVLAEPKHFVLACRTIGEAFDCAIRNHGADSPAVGYRQVVSAAPGEVEGKPITRYELTEYQWLSYGDLRELVSRTAHGMAKLGIGKGDRVMIFADTCANWMICAQAIFRIDSVLATLYATLGDEGIVHGIQETEVEYIITSVPLAHKLIRLRDRLDRLKHIILLSGTDDEQAELVELLSSTEIKVTSFAELVRGGDPNFEPKSEANENDVAIIMYTSGSGGIPKGVMATHRNVIHGFKSTLSLIANYLDEVPRHTYIGYLPLAHIFEFGTETLLLFIGCRIGYSTPHTITDLSPGLLPGTPGDATLLQPTVMASVPLVLDRIRKAIYTKLNSRGLFVVRLFEFVIEYKNFWRSKGFETPIVDRVFLTKVRAVLGGKLELLVTGGAPLSADTQKFIRTCLNIKFSQGYGSTEMVASGLFMDEFDHSLGKVGGPAYGLKVKLVDWPEGGYCTRDRPHPRGEIHVSSPSLSVGYFKLDRLTAETYYVDRRAQRWFRTGDIGELFPNGTFKIIDRKKDFIKLQFGEYISLGKIETKLKTSYIVNNICVVGNSLYNYVIAIVVPNPRVVQKIARIVDCADPDPYESVKVREAIRAKLTKYARANGLRRYEIPCDLLLVRDDWTPESGLVTASFKLKRKNIEQHYADSIRHAFDKMNWNQ